MNQHGIIARYRDHLPVSDNTPLISLHEGSTPLLRLHRLPQKLAHPIELYVKYEGLNPTGSFKDRGMTLAVSKAAEAGSKAILCASTGNTSAAAAAYAARGGLRAFVLIPKGKIALGKLAQSIAYGATILQIDGNFDEGMRLVREVAEEDDQLTLVNSVNPFRLQGQKTAAFEIVDALHDVPHYHALPVGNAGNISAHWMGYQEYRQQGRSNASPIMLGYQAAGSAPMVVGHDIEQPETIATAIRIGKPQSAALAQQAVDASGGWFRACEDHEILAAQALLAQCEGIFCEPASATSIAGVFKDVADGRITAGSRVVCTLTGHGLKDPDIALRQADDVILSIAAERKAVRAHILA